MIRLERIVQLVKDDVSEKDIARILHCDVGQAVKIKRKIGNRSKCVISREVYLRLLACGLGDFEVAYVFGISKKELETWKVREGVAKVPVG